MDYTYSFQIKYLDNPERRALQFYRSWKDDGGWHEEVYTTTGWKEAEPWQQTPVEELPQDHSKNRSRMTQRGKSTSAPIGSTTDSTSTS